MIEVFNKHTGIDVNEWDLLVESSNTSSFFQTKVCYDFYLSLSFLEPFLFCVYECRKLKGVVIGYIQSDGGKLERHFSRRAIVLGGAMLSNDISGSALERLLNECRINLEHRAIFIEFRNFNDYSKYKIIFKRCGFEYQPHLNFHVDCTLDKETTLRRFSESKRRQIKKALKNGTNIIEAHSKREIVEFYQVLEDLYKTKVKTPLFPLDFFVKFFESGVGRIFLIRHEKQIIGGILCPILGTRVIHEWFVAGKDTEYKDSYPSVLATYAAIRYALDNGIKRFDFMGAGKPDEEYGVREFKSKFGGVLVEHGRFVAINKPFLYSFGKLGLSILKKLSG